MTLTTSADRFGRSFLEAAAVAPADERWFTFARRAVRVRATGRKLAAATFRPFAHLESDGFAAEAALTVDLWDEAETGVLGPPFAARARGEVLVEGTAITHVTERAVTRLDRAAGRICGWCAEGETVAFEYLSKPLPVVLQCWYADQQVNVVHAGLVARGSAGVLFAGAAGSGKSTAALACAAAGLSFLGDDQIGLEERPDGGFLGHSLYSTARLAHADLARFPELGCGAPRTEIEDEEKALLFLAETQHVRVERAADIQAIVLLRHGNGRRSGLSRATAAQALLALGPTSLVGVPGGGRQAFERLARLVDRVPAFWADLDAGPVASTMAVEHALSAT